MTRKKIEIGDIFEVPTAIGNAYIQYMAEVDQTTLIRLLPGVYHEPVDLEKLVQQKERYICFVPLGIALRRKYIRKVGFSEVKKFKVPKYFKTVSFPNFLPIMSFESIFIEVLLAFHLHFYAILDQAA